MRTALGEMSEFKSYTWTERLLIWLQEFLGITSLHEEVYELDKQRADAIADLRTEFDSRLSELEKSYAQGSIKQSKEEPVEPIVRGHVPLSVRRRQFEMQHAKPKNTPHKQGTS